MRIFHLFLVLKFVKRNQKQHFFFICIIFYSSSKRYFQFPSFSDKFEVLVKSKMAAILTTILDDVMAPSSVKAHNFYLML